jgi:hypothetical protein
LHSSYILREGHLGREFTTNISGLGGAGGRDLTIIKHSEKFHAIFGGNLISMNTLPTKDDGSYTYSSKSGIQIMPAYRIKIPLILTK